MKFNQTILYVVAAAITILPGCKKWVSKDDININPNKPAFATLNTLLPAVEDATSSNHFLVAYTTSMFSQHMASYQSGPINDDQNRDVRMASAYFGLYQNGLNNSKLLIDLAVEKGSPHYAAIGRILLVLNLALATDTYGNVPFTEAFKAPEILYPKYDDQQGLYTTMQQYLDQAITEIGQANPAALKPATDDLIYNGVMAKWLQTANFLKARLIMHTTKKGASAAAASVLPLLANAYSSNANDLQLVYNDRNINPWNRNVSARILTGNFTITPAKRFVDALNGTTFTGLVDPRISIIIDKRTATSWSGIQNGSGATGNTTDLTNQTFYAKTTSPLVMGSFAEQKLMEAEARFLANGGTSSTVGSTQAAFDAYLEGIKDHMKKVGVPAASITTYTTHPLVAAGPANLTLEHILRERQVVLFLNPEAWVDVRRYNYDPLLFKGITLPLNQDAGMGGNFIRRSGLPLDELNRNPNAQSALKPLSQKVWWDE